MTHQILIVDDHPTLPAMIAEMLEDAGYDTRTAAGGRDALVDIKANPPDLLVTDVNMPGLDGFALASAVKSNPDTATIPIIMLSAHAGRGARMVGLHSGAEDYLTKPVDPAELLAKIRNLLLLRDRSATRASH